ncbi:DNA polymerase III subunit delta [Veillonella rodentium]|uniref:DNA polymerase III subunit delta n=1 Tax=Veillonella rodentium TaxID=248315 RepID=A0A239Z228_9FIRM|nr:DNA polymerase III subunit delta [Veillonella rodentium]SNV65471.1 DNA polymerase III subunit delta [Veillonella rodentium]
MAQIYLIYGDEPQLIEEEKQKFLATYPDLPVVVLDDEAGPQKISEQLCEDSLFGDQKVFCLVNLPIIRKSGKNSDAWTPLYELLIDYKGDNPIVLIYHDMIDKRIKQNKEILERISNHQCKRLEGADLVMWIHQYCTSQGFKLTPDAQEYVSHLIELWQNVPVSFMRTEFDRYFLQITGERVITEKFLEENSSDYGAKNIFAFKEALLKRDVNTLLELFPFMFSYKELDRAMSYIEGQLRLQLLVSECRQAGMSVKAVENLCKDNNSSFKPYPIKLAYEASSRISIKALRALLKGLYEIILDSRSSKGDIWRFRDLCMTYCGYKG